MALVWRTDIDSYGCFSLQAAISSGSADFDQLVAVILQSGMIMGAVIACILDNTIPGTDEERGNNIYLGCTSPCYWLI